MCLPAAFLLLTVSGTTLHAYQRQDLMDDAALIIRVSNTVDFLEAIESSSLGQLWNSSEMKAFINNQNLGEAIKDGFMHSVHGEKLNNKALAHLYWEEMKLLKSEVVFGISPPDKEDNTPFYMIAAVDKADHRRMLELDERIDELDDEVSIVGKEDFQGVEIIRLDRVGETGEKETTWGAYYEGTSVTSTIKEWVERCILRLKKELPSNPDKTPTLHMQINQAFIKAMLEGKKTPPGEVPKTGEQAALTPNGPDVPDKTEPGTPVPSGAAILKALGLDNLQFISLDLFLKPGAMEFQFQVKSFDTGVKKGLWTLLNRERIPANHRLAYVPDDIVTYQVMRLDINAFWKEVPDIIQAINPQSARYFQAFEGMFKGMYQIDLSRDVFGNLGTLITTYSRMDGIIKEELTAFQLRSGEQMDKLLAKIFGEGSMLKAQMQDRMAIYEVHGHKLYSFKPISPLPPAQPGQPGQPGQPQTTGPAAQPRPDTGVAVIDGSLVFGTDKLVRSLIQAVSSPRTNNANTNSLYKNPVYTKLMRKVPDDAVGYAITDFSRLLQPLLSLVRDPMLGPAFKMKDLPVEPGAEKEKPEPLEVFFQNLRFDRLPPADFMASFFGKGVNYTRFDGNNLVTLGSFGNRDNDKK
jgi:hypothetical protein